LAERRSGKMSVMEWPFADGVLRAFVYSIRADAPSGLRS